MLRDRVHNVNIIPLFALYIISVVIATPVLARYI